MIPLDKDLVISFENFGFQYTAQAEPTLYDITLNIRKGEKILIAGPSGCGKSTLAHCINGLAPNSYPGKSTGRLTVGGKTQFACVDGPEFDAHEIDFDEAIARSSMYREFERHAYEKACNLFKEVSQNG